MNHSPSPSGARTTAPPATAPSEAGWGPLLPVAIVVFLEGLAVACAFPVLSAYTESLGGSAAVAGVLFALVTAPKIVMNPWWGRWSDRRGRRGTLLVLTVGTCLGSVLWALAPQLGGIVLPAILWLGLSRLVTGVFSSQAAVAFAAISDRVAGARRSAAFGLIGAAFGLAFTIGPALGGFLADLTTPAAVGWLMAAAQALSLATILTLVQDGYRCPTAGGKAIDSQSSARTFQSLADPPTSVAEPTQPVRPSTHSAAPLPSAPLRASSQRRLWSRRPVLMALLATTALTAAQAALLPTLEPVIDDRYGFGLAEAGWLFGLLGLVGVFVQGGAIRPLRRHASEGTIAAAGAVILAAGLALLAFDLHPALFILGLCGVAAGGALSTPTVTAIASHAAREDEQGAVHGLVQSMTSVGRVLGFLLGPALLTATTASVTFLGAAACALASLIALVSIPRDGASPAGEPTDEPITG